MSTAAVAVPLETVQQACSEPLSFSGLGWFAQAGGSTQRVRLFHVRRIVEAGHHHYRNAHATRSLLDPPKELKTVATRHMEVRKDQRRESGFLLVFQGPQELRRFDAISNHQKLAAADYRQESVA